MTLNPACGCGCGEQVKLARSGKPNQFLHGHYLRGRPKTPTHRAKLSAAAKGRPGPWLGKTIPPEARQKMSLAKKGKKLSAEHRSKIAATMTGKPHPSIHHKQSIDTRLKRSLAQRGARGSNWQGGISEANRIARSSIEFKEWRRAVFERDGYICQDCGARSGCGHRVELHPHHIKPFARFPELRFEVSNGVTLCKSCHGIRHGRGAK